MKRYERLEKWAKELTEQQAKDVLVDMVEFTIEAEYVAFYDSSLAPYYDSTGDPLVEGQKTYEDD